MRNPAYVGDFQSVPMPERWCKMSYLQHPDGPPGDLILPQPMLSIGIKTMTKTHAGFEIKAHKTVVVEITEGDELASFDLPVSGARTLARRLVEFADAIEIKEAS